MGVLGELERGEDGGLLFHPVVRIEAGLHAVVQLLRFTADARYAAEQPASGKYCENFYGVFVE